jgi:hypothetical protein
MAFTELRVSRPSDADLRPSTTEGLRRVQSLKVNRVAADPRWRVAPPPPGFALRGGRRLGDSVQLLYSDGLASVSVYIEPIAGARSGENALAPRRGQRAHALRQRPAHRRDRQGAGGDGHLFRAPRRAGRRHARRHALNGTNPGRRDRMRQSSQPNARRPR